MRCRASIALVFLTLTLGACSLEPIVHGLSEREANRVVELLDDREIEATKVMVDTGREVMFTIQVPGKARLDAIRILNLHEMPPRPTRGYGEVFGEAGLIPTSTEERAKHLSAIEGEIERQLRLVEGILDVEVQLVIPQESALKTTDEQQIPTTASVTIRYLAGAGGAKPLTEPQVQAVVAAGVEKLTADRVVVVMTPVGKADTKLEAPRAKRRFLGGVSDKGLRVIFIVAVLLVLILLVALLYALISLQTVRKKFERLQSEIAKARKKQPAAAEGGGSAA